MTKPCYQLQGCAARSEVRGGASSSPYVPNPDDYVWGVNFNNGNTNINHRNNEARGRLVRGPVVPSSSGEYQNAESKGTVSLRDLFNAWQNARKRKRPSRNQMLFEANWIDRLIDLQERINTCTWQPSPTTCFIAKKPKAREIHAPDFADRVVHHLVVPPLEKIFEPQFIHDSFSNQKGKGTHAAVGRLRTYMRQVKSGQQRGWTLKLDIRNFFNCVNREKLYRVLKRAMERAGVPEVLQRLVHALLKCSPLKQGVVHRSTEAERALVPAHKRLEQAAPDCGLPIGNLSSQFFANVFLHALDLFVKHVLKVKRYVRYVDDFVLVHESREQLQAWLAQIQQFLQDKLQLSLKDDIQLRPIDAGVDFLGYIIHPTHSLVRPRVIAHARESLSEWQRDHIRECQCFATPVDLRRLRSRWASYQGHFRHARAHRLEDDFRRRYPWLDQLTAPRRTHWRAEHRVITLKLIKGGNP